MENTLPQPQPTEPLGYTSDYTTIMKVYRGLRNLSRFLSVTENGIHSFVYSDPSGASHEHRLIKQEIEQLRHTIDTIRPQFEGFFKILEAEAFLENPPAMSFPVNRNPNSTISIWLKLNAGLTGCRNSIKSLLAIDEESLKNEIQKGTIGKMLLGRLASLSMILGEIKFGSSEEIRAMVSTLREKIVKRPEPLPKPTSRLRKTMPIIEESQGSQTQPEKKVESLGLAIPTDPAKSIQKDEFGLGRKSKKKLESETNREPLPYLKESEKPLATQLAESFEPMAPRLQISKEFEHLYLGCLDKDLYRIDEKKTGEQLCKDFRINFGMKENEAIVGFRGKHSWKIIMVKGEALIPMNAKLSR